MPVFTPRHEIPARATSAMVRAAMLAIEAAGQPKMAKGYVGDQFPPGTHSFVMGNLAIHQVPLIEDEELGGEAVFRPVRIRLTLGRVRQASFLDQNCGPLEWLGDAPECAEPLPKLPEDICDENTVTTAETERRPTVSDVWIQTTTDREIVLSAAFKRQFCAQLKTCNIPGGKSLRLETYEPFEEGRFAGSRIEWSAKLG